VAFELKTINRTRLYESIVDQLLDGIRRGAFPPNSILPSERVLATELKVSRSSIREAIRVLEHAGVLEVRSGSGTYVTESGISKAAALRAHAALLGEYSPLDVMVVRRAVEPTSAWHAAIQHRTGDVETLSGLLRDHAALLGRGEDAAGVDLEFHVALSAATRNPVLILVTEQIAAIMRQGTWRQLKHQATERTGYAQRFLQEHQEILAAVARRDPRLAQDTMRAHLDAVESSLTAEIEES
jgi:GntR family transcriptional repressor for pyruvate dehydrogenase complex